MNPRRSPKPGSFCLLLHAAPLILTRLLAIREALLKLFAEKKIRGVVYDSKSYNGLESVPEALRALGARETWGKVVVRVVEPESKL